MPNAELVAAIGAAPSHVSWTTEQARVEFDPPLRLPGQDKVLLSMIIHTTRFPDGGHNTAVFGTAATLRDGAGSHQIRLPRELADRYLPAAHAA